MKIETISIDLSCEKDVIRRRFRMRLDGPLIGDFPPLIKLLGSSSRGPVTFRINDAPDVAIEWHRFGRTSAVTYIVRHGSASLATVQLTGSEQRNDDDALAHLAAIVPAFGSWVSQNPLNAARPLLVMVTLRQIDDDDITPIIPLICLMPALCELAELT